MEILSKDGLVSSSGVEEREDQHRDGQRQRTQTSRPDLYSASKTFGLPLGPSDGSSCISTHGRCVCLCTPRESTHTGVYRVLIYAYVSITPYCIHFYFFPPFFLLCIGIAAYVYRFANENGIFIYLSACNETHADER